ncbi:MAG: hypothetical protein PWP15_1093 [Methanothermococcus sp.]|uniref:hypothetical protein n=1 Tax=Methanothermococcus sp. TaxID=2614238 RepID=UPI00258983BB|nr:hypothetical protein [Methanothermococcus sp.]MDK2790586.1 hypothetical protein [Methanothermococcus sp.]
MKNNNTEIQSQLIIATKMIESTLSELNLKFVIRQLGERIVLAFRDVDSQKDYLVRWENNNYKIIELSEER